MGSFDVSVPFPGVPIFTDTYLGGFGGGSDIHPSSRRFFGSVMIGAIPLDPPNYTIGVTGTVSITFVNGGPVVVEVKCATPAAAPGPCRPRPVPARSPR